MDLRNLSIAQLQKVQRDMEIKKAKLDAAVSVREEFSGLGSMPTHGAMKHMNNVNHDGTDLNSIIWPYFFNVASDVVKKNGGQHKASFLVSQEAAFVWTEMVKVVYSVDFTSTPVLVDYIDPRELTGNGDANGLKFTLVDGSSSRAFMNDYVPLDQLASPVEPFRPDRPLMFMPNQLIEVDLVNTNPNRDFVVMLVFKGYRIRVDGKQELVSMIG